MAKRQTAFGVELPLSPRVEKLRVRVMNACALMLVLTPPLVWFGHTQFIFVSVMSAGIGSGVLYCLLHRLEIPPPHYERPGPPGIPDAFFEELIELSPLTSHHRITPEGRFQVRMNRLHRLVTDKRMQLFRSGR